MSGLTHSLASAVSTKKQTTIQEEEALLDVDPLDLDDRERTQLNANQIALLEELGRSFDA